MTPIRWDLLFLVGLVIGSLLGAVAVRNHRAWHWPGLLALLAVNSFYGFGIAATLNQDLDSVVPQTHSAQVMAKRIARFRSRDSYYLKLGPWGPRATPAEVVVDKQAHDQTPVGGTVCVILHPGALRSPWFQTKTCGASIR